MAGNSDAMNWFLIILGCLVFLGAVIGGLYVTFGICIYGGIFSIITGFQTIPLSASMIAWGIVKILCSTISGYLTFAAGSFLAAGIFTAIK